VIIPILTDSSVTKFGLFNPWLFLGAILAAVAGGIFTTFDLHTTNAMINGIQVMGEMGLALLLQTVSISQRRVF